MRFQALARFVLAVSLWSVAACMVAPSGVPGRVVSDLDRRFHLSRVGSSGSDILYRGALRDLRPDQFLEELRGDGWRVAYAEYADIPLSTHYSVAPKKGDYVASKSWPEEDGRITILLEPDNTLYVYYFYSN